MCTMACRSPVEFPYADHFIEFEIPPLSLAEGSFGNLEWEIEFGWHVASMSLPGCHPIYNIKACHHSYIWSAYGR